MVLWAGGFIEVNTKQLLGLKPSQRLDAEFSYLVDTVHYTANKLLHSTFIRVRMGKVPLTNSQIHQESSADLKVERH